LPSEPGYYAFAEMATQRLDRARRHGLAVTTWAAASALLSCAAPTGSHFGWSGRELDAERRCQQGAAAACGELGRSLLSRKGSDADRERGLVLLEVACGQDDWPSCTALGEEYTGKHESALGRAREILGRACDHGAGPACMALGETYGTGSGRNVKAAIASYKRACELGDGAGCEVYGFAQRRETFGGDKAAAEEAFERACALGQGSSCRYLARERLSDPARRAEGMKMLQNGCLAGDAESCLQAALLFAPLVSASPRCDQAKAFGRRACDDDNPAGCTVVLACQPATPQVLAQLRAGCERHEPLACLYWADTVSAQPPTATPIDRELVRGAYEIACRSGEWAAPVACPRLASAALADAESSADAERPLSFLKQACEGGLGAACCALSAEYARGKWLPTDPARAAELRARACDLGQTACCASAAVPVPTK
jgi:TPR repeat protein